MTSVATALMRMANVLPLHRVLLIEGDKAIQCDLQHLFLDEGYAVEIAINYAEGLELFRNAPPTVLVLDVQIAGTCGHELFDKVHCLNPSVPIIVLGARSSKMEGVLFLKLGADDYVVKPFSGRELLARVRAVMRRSEGHCGDTFAFSDLQVDFRKMEVKRQGALVPLTAQEFKVLKFMTRNADRVISREELLNEVWGYHNYPTTRTVDNHMLKLRQKLERHPSDPVHFLTVHSVGYKFVPHSPERCRV